ncbi:hypothetical protein Tco_0970178 [Tanacetum coccineum]
MLLTTKSEDPRSQEGPAKYSNPWENSFNLYTPLYAFEFEKKAQGEKKRYIDLIEKSVKDIIKDEVKSQLSQILPKEVSDCATLLDKDEDPLAGSDQGLKRRKTSKDAEPSKGSKSKQSKSISSKGTNDLGNTDDQPNVEATLERDWFKKPERPSTPDSNWNARKSIDFRPPQTWISRIAQTEKPHLTFDELMSTPIDFSAYVMNNLKIDNLTQEHPVGPAFNLLKGTCRSRVELEYHFEECYKAITNRLDLNNPKGQEYPFELSKPLSLIEDRDRQVVHVNYFINNDFEYLKGGSSS